MRSWLGHEVNFKAFQEVYVVLCIVYLVGLVVWLQYISYRLIWVQSECWYTMYCM